MIKQNLYVLLLFVMVAAVNNIVAMEDQGHHFAFLIENSFDKKPENDIELTLDRLT